MVTPDQGVGLVAPGPGQLGSAASPSAGCQCVPEMGPLVDDKLTKHGEVVTRECADELVGSRSRRGERHFG